MRNDATAAHSLTRTDNPEASTWMPKKPNYDYEKRQKEIARKQKQEDKRARKREAEQRPDAPAESAPDAPPESATR